MAAKYQTVVNQVLGYLVPSLGQQIMQIMGHGIGIPKPKDLTNLKVKHSSSPRSDDRSI